jgi:hypothetical protein
MCPPERHDERDRDAEEVRGFQRSPEKSIERFAAGIFKHQHGSIAVAHQLKRPSPPTLYPAHPSIRVRGSDDRGSSGDGRVCGRQNDEHGLAYAIIARAPPSAQERSRSSDKI